jgi:hypothetical protein
MSKGRNLPRVSQKAMREWEQYKKRSKNWAIRKGFDLLHSEAYRSLDYAPALKVLDYFLERRKVRALKGKGSKKRYETINNGEISFTYEEARCRGLSDQQFSWALKRLHAVGLIDVEEHGTGMMGSYTKYALSERWRDYGTRNFKRVEFPGSNYIGYRRPKEDKSNGEFSSLVNSENSWLELRGQTLNCEISPSKGLISP